MSEREIPAGWETAEIADVSDVGGGLTKNSSRSSLLLRRPYLRVANVYANELRLSVIAEIGVTEAEAQKTTLEAGDVLVVEGNGSVDQIGRVAMWDGSIKGCLHQNHLIRIRSRAVIFPKFLLQWLLSPEGRMAIERKASSSAGLYTLSISKIASLPIPVPPLPEQRRIVKKVEALTARSRRAREALDALPAFIDRYRQSILAAAFRGDLTAEWRDTHSEGETAKAFLARNGLDVEEIDVEDIPVKLPETWRWARLSDVAEVKGGLAKGKKRPAGVALESVPYLRVANVQRGFLDLSEVKEIEATAEEIEQLRLRAGDILFNEGGDRDKLGRGWVWSGEIDRCIHQNHVFRARLRSAEINPFLISHFGNTFGQQYFFGEGKQSVNLASISLSKLKAFPVPVIPPAEQVVLCARIEEALRRVEVFRAAWRSASERLPALDQSILAKAFRGELVPQDPNDEPASVLLERIRAERAAAGEKPRRGRRAARG